jgi:hypothetical protein
VRLLPNEVRGAPHLGKNWLALGEDFNYILTNEQEVFDPPFAIIPDQINPAALASSGEENT